MPNLQIIQDWVPEHKKVIHGHYDRKISTFFDAEDKNEQFQNLHQLLVKWAVLTGVKPLPLDDEIRLFVEYIAEHFYRYSLSEIDNAFNFATAGKLAVDAEHYQSYSVIYISRIINAYGDYKGEYILAYRAELEKEETREPTEDERLVLLVDSIIESYENYKEDPYYNHFGYVSYDFLKRVGVIDFDNDTKAEILKEAREKAVENLTNRVGQDGKHEPKDLREMIANIQNDPTGKEEEVIKCCKNIGLMYYYDYILKNNISLEGEIQKALNDGRGNNTPHKD